MHVNLRYISSKLLLLLWSFLNLYANRLEMTKLLICDILVSIFTESQLQLKENIQQFKLASCHALSVSSQTRQVKSDLMR
jgi:hypothetical protein